MSEAAGWAGVFVFAISGAALACECRLDLFGVMALGCVTALSGGIALDILIGSVPPEDISSWHGVAVAGIASLLTFFGRPLLDRVRHPVLLFDALGLALFAVGGTQKALEYSITPVMAAILGMIAGIAGGLLRDILVVRTPIVLRTDIYAIAALAAGIIVAFGARSNITAAMVIGGSVCVLLRLLAIYFHWALPGASKSRT